MTDDVVIGNYYFGKLAPQARKKGWMYMTVVGRSESGKARLVESCRALFGDPIEVYGGVPYFPEKGKWIVLSYRREYTLYFRSLDQAKQACMHMSLIAET